MGRRKFNDYYDENDYMVCVCTNGGKFIFDKEDYNKLKPYSWRMSKSGKIETSIKRKTVSLSRFLFPDVPKNNKILLTASFDYRKSTMFTGNIYTKHDTYYTVRCYDGQSFMIDIDDYSVAKDYTWHIDPNHYAISKINGRVIKLHRLIMGVVDCPDVEIDHINRNTIDNRKCNLRIADRSLNCYNQRLSKYNTSGHSGVYKSKNYDKWCVQISHQGKRYYLGSYATLEDAIAVRKQSELELFNELLS